MIKVRKQGQSMAGRSRPMAGNPRRNSGQAPLTKALRAAVRAGKPISHPGRYSLASSRTKNIENFLERNGYVYREPYWVKESVKK